MYFFHLHDRGNIVDDPEGTDLPDVYAARDYAISNARDIMAANVREGRLDLSSFIVVVDALGAVVADVTYREALTLSGLQSI